MLIKFNIVYWTMTTIIRIYVFLVDNDDDNDIEEDEEVQVEKYRRLMKELNKDEKDDSDNCDMEITWEPGN